MSKNIVAIVGSYRKEGTIDSAVETILAAARQKGAATHTIYLTEQHIEFCRNCRTCTQIPGSERGKCPQEDDLEPILREIEAADAVVLGSPVNCGNVTAIFQRFMERLLGCAYWPWGHGAPRARTRNRPRKAALVASSAMPGIFIPLFTRALTSLRGTAGMLGARPVGTMCVGLAAGEPHHELSPRQRSRAHRIGLRLA